MKVLKYFAIFVLMTGLGVGAFVYSGIYPMGADVPHNALSYRLLETLRERSITRASGDVLVPALDEPDLLLAGGADYNDMCAVCHLKPGTSESDMSLGLYPAPPDLSRVSHRLEQDDQGESARRQFWIIKHGIKASGMPAWGPTHDDRRIWAMVAFLQRLPQLTAAQYQILTARGEGADNAGSGHH